MTMQQDARKYFQLCLKNIPKKRMGLVEDYANHMIDTVEPLAMLKMDWESVQMDFDLYCEIIENAGDQVFRDRIIRESTDNLLNMLPGNVIVVDFPEREHPFHVDLADAEVDSTTASFVCDICHQRFPENKGWLSRPKDSIAGGVASLHDIDCINAHHLIVEPEEKDRRG